MTEFDFRVVGTFGVSNQLKYKRYLNPEGIQKVLSYKDKGDISNFLLFGFYWEDTPQGRNFWQEVCNAALRGDLRPWEEKGRPLFVALFSLELVPSVEEML